MKVDKSELYTLWYEDEPLEERRKCTKYPVADSVELPEALKGRPYTYHARFIGMVTEEITVVDETGKTVNSFAINSTYNPELAVAMANSGDFTYEEAVKVIIDCCERCLNILYNKYLGEKNFHSSYLYKNWDRPCKFCEEADDKYFEGLEDGHSMVWKREGQFTLNLAVSSTTDGE